MFDIPQYSSITPFDPTAHRGTGYQNAMNNSEAYYNTMLEIKNKQSGVPYNVRTPRFFNFPILEPFYHNVYRSIAAYNAMLETRDKQSDVPYQSHTPKQQVK
ncbi:hypothetical protein B0H65DRAFT_545019 [Neurospora tetraspora]|uniref:Uncharacterized protein n=1 Tax=Neurospora tetraspora TaxID=94610 RepID=A0AAE0MXB3_9PEZI|nr:hypothetical protein B0H65DRAFT_545019 [Neurospora tetraspora]